MDATYLFMCVMGSWGVELYTMLLERVVSMCVEIALAILRCLRYV